MREKINWMTIPPPPTQIPGQQDNYSGFKHMVIILWCYSLTAKLLTSYTVHKLSLKQTILQLMLLGRPVVYDLFQGKVINKMLEKFMQLFLLLSNRAKEKQCWIYSGCQYRVGHIQVM